MMFPNLKKRKCALKGCSKIFLPKCPVQIYCCIGHSLTADAIRNEKRSAENVKGIRAKTVELSNGIELINNVIAQGILPDKVVN